MTHRPQRPTEPICPPWCAGHDELFQPWELDGPNRSRDHSQRAAQISGDGYAAGVELTATESVKHELSAARGPRLRLRRGPARSGRPHAL